MGIGGGFQFAVERGGGLSPIGLPRACHELGDFALGGGDVGEYLLDCLFGVLDIALARFFRFLLGVLGV